MQELADWLAYYELDALLHKELARGKSPEEALQIVTAMIELHDGAHDV